MVPPRLGARAVLNPDYTRNRTSIRTFTRSVKSMPPNTHTQPWRPPSLRHYSSISPTAPAAFAAGVFIGSGTHAQAPLGVSAQSMMTSGTASPKTPPLGTPPLANAKTCGVS
jgi:hypothetical protein